MDEYDEQMYKKVAPALDSGMAEELLYGRSLDHYPLRLYEKDEQLSQTCNIASASMAHPKTKLSHIELQRLLYTPQRVRRFFHTVKGFHRGNLDLMGRFESRYMDLILRWKLFSSQLCEIRRQDDQRTNSPVDDKDNPPARSWDERPLFDTADVVHPDLLSSFCSKWRFDSNTIAADLKPLYRMHDNVQACLKRHPKPKFQQLRFLHLPAELIHRVMQYMSRKECRKLSRCSRMLREASLLHVYDDLRFELKIPKPQAEPSQRPQTADEKIERARTLLDRILREFVEQLTEVCDRPAAPLRIRKLRIRNDVNLEKLRVRNQLTAAEFSQRLEPLSTLVNKLISQAHNLETLSLRRIPLLPDAAERFLTLPHLHTVMLEDLNETETPMELSCDSILNATFLPREDDDTTWYILPSLTSLRWLAILNSDARDALPPEDVREIANVFTNLERIMLYNLSARDFPELVDWIRQAVPPHGPGLRLTQFKLELVRPLIERDFREIISALHGAPMQDFVVDGLAYAEPALFDLVAHAFPNLQSLTIGYQKHRLDSGHPAACWPRASWEYAPHFANFTQLRHFGWNWRLPAVATASPSAMLLFEHGFPEQWEAVASCAMDSFADEWESIPRLFHAHCASLRSMSFRKQRSSRLMYRLYTAEGEGLRVCATSLSANSSLLRKYDPKRRVGWPKFIPPQHGTDAD